MSWLSGQNKVHIEKSFHQTPIKEKAINSQALLDAFHLSTNETLESKNTYEVEIIRWARDRCLEGKLGMYHTWNFKTMGAFNLSRDVLGAPIIIYLLITHVLCLYATLLL